MEIIIEGYLQALRNFASAEIWLIMAIGLLIGFFFGIVPGISGAVALALILPFVFKMSPLQALPLMMAIMATQYQGGSISTILLGLPGTPGSAATILDGFAMSKKGEAGRALGAAQMSSALSNIITALMALAIIPLVLPIAFAIHSQEMVFITMLGVSFIAVLGSGSQLKGLISAGIGFLISLIGFQATTAVPRFTFGSLYLYGGFSIIPVVLGLFALPEMVALAARGGTISRVKVEIKGFTDVLRGVRDVFHHWPLVLRSNVIAFLLGLIPAIGASAATFVAYGQAKQMSKHPETFGQGNVEGVIAPESANNAVEAGALLTTLALGIPGSGIMALMLGAFVILGLQPGPEMLTKHLGLSLSLIWVIGATAVMGLPFYLPLCTRMAAVATTPARILVPLVIVVLSVGSFVYHGVFNDLLATFAFGIIGTLMRRYQFNRPALFLAFVLGPLLEKYLFISLKLSGPMFFLRPVSLVIMVVII
ncbi:MAG: tripartite tricarboxylate transporter permease, partial [Chloroflexota bacterium]